MRLAVLVAAALGAAAASAALPFKEGERVVFLGDSITRGGHHLRVIEDYVLTRYPGVDIRFRNAGVGGDTAAACASRVADDVTTFRPAWVAVMFGMNDIARGCYVAEPTQRQINSRNWALGHHRDSMTDLSARLRAEIPGVNLVWCTPSPYDENVVYSPPIGTSVGADAALETCSVFVRGLAAKKGDRLVEFHSTMNAYNALRQQTDPSFTLCGTDRIHPGKVGGLYMGWRFLMDMGADALVSSVVLAADSAICTSAENATVTDVASVADGVSFTVHEKALPFPVDPEAAAVASTLPLAENLNSEIVRVTGLAPGNYALAIDGIEVERKTAAEWAAGVNLAFNPKTPQFKVARRLSERNGVRNQNESNLRILHMVRWWLGRNGITNADDFVEIRAKRSSLPQKGFYAEHLNDYLERWPQHQQLWQAVEDEWKALVALAKTEPHVYSVVKVRERRPDYEAIVIPARSSESVRYAAAELNAFLKKTTGRTLTVVDDSAPLTNRAILVGLTRKTGELLGPGFDPETLGDEGFRLVARPPHFLIVGSEKRGALYGVYEFLERFAGCRWYSSWCSVVPTGQALRIPPDFDETQRPAFALRESYWYDMFDGDFAARCKMNGNRARLTARHGGQPCRFGKGLGAAHTFMTLVPPAKYFKEHPEYFSMIGGKRTDVMTQLCLTNPDLVEIVTDRILEAIAKEPEAKFFGISPEDRLGNCTCPACRAVDEEEGSPAGTLVRFVNRVAEEVEKRHPDKVLVTLAYHYTRTPPRKTKARRNVTVCLCPIECDYAFPISESRFGQNRSFVRDIEGWAKMAESLYIWDYVTDFNWYPHAFPNVLSMRENVRFFRAHGVKYLFEQGAYQGRHAEFAELKAWLLAKWMWNPDLPQEELLDDFFDGYYGKASKVVRRYFDALHTVQRRRSADGTNPLSIREDVAAETLSDAFLSRAAALWEEAEGLVRDDPVRSYNVRMSAFSTDFTRVMRVVAAAEKVVAADGHPPVADYVGGRDLADKVLKKMKEAGDIRLCEPKAMDRDSLAGIRQLAEGFVPGPIGTSAPMTDFTLQQPGVWCDFVEDPLAEGGRALKLYGTHFQWCAMLRMNRVAFPPGKRIRLRLRARVVPKKGRRGEAFWAGVYDLATRSGAINSSVPVPEDVSGYRWYDIGACLPNAMQTIWIGPGRWPAGGESVIEYVCFDRFEITTVGDE